MKTGFSSLSCCLLLFSLTAVIGSLRASDFVVATRQGTLLQAAATNAPLLPGGSLTLAPHTLDLASAPVIGSIKTTSVAVPASSFSRPECYGGASDASYQPAIDRSWAVSDAPDFETILGFADSADPLMLAPLTPVAEPSTWVAASFATLFLAWQSRRFVTRRRATFIGNWIAAAQCWALNISRWASFFSALARRTQRVGHRAPRLIAARQAL